MRRWAKYLKKPRPAWNTILYTVALVGTIQFVRHYNFFVQKITRFSKNIYENEEYNVFSSATVTTPLASFLPIIYINIEESGENDSDSNCFEKYLAEYKRYCESVKRRWDRHGNDDVTARRNVTSSTTLCACVPSDLARYTEVSYNAPSQKTLDLLGASLHLGGSWWPLDCRAIQRIALIIPFRDRLEHLRILLMRLHPMLQKQRYNYTIFVVEQFEKNALFNKAILMNSAFKLIFVNFLKPLNLKLDYDCVVFHDVDLLPSSDYNFYQCLTDQARHVAGYVDKWNYKLLYPRIFGGGTSFLPRIFIEANGFSNKFYGWGGEDDDMLNRVEAANYTFVRYPSCVSKYKMLRHPFHKNNPYMIENSVGFTARPVVHYQEDGLSSVPFKHVSTHQLGLYTHIVISVPSPPPSI